MIATLVLLGIAAPQWTPLFDGKTLQGWKPLNGSAPFAAEGGAIVGRTVAGSPNSFLCTEKQYADFDLEFEILVDPATLSGVQFRSNSVPGYQNGRVHGYQVEVDPSERARSGGLYDEARRGWLSDLSDNERARKAFRNGQWNRFRVLAEGDRIRTWVNGVPAVDFRDGMTARGFIALQLQANEKPGLETRWRNLRVRDLGDPWAEPPKGGQWLLRGPDDVSKWMQPKNPGAPIAWKWKDGSLECEPSSGDIVSKQSFGDCRLHLEFMVDDNGREGQGNGNSGLYLMQSYEVQILNSAPRGPLINECAAIYNIKAPDFAMALPAYQWQSYDVLFTAAKFEDGKKVSNARLTLYHNGTRVHDRVEIPKPTGAGAPETPTLRPLRIQDHGNRIRLRNIWIAPL